MTSDPNEEGEGDECCCFDSGTQGDDGNTKKMLTAQCEGQPHHHESNHEGLIMHAAHEVQQHEGINAGEPDGSAQG